MPKLETIDQKLRLWCADMRAEGYTPGEIFFALHDEAKRLDDLADITSDPASSEQADPGAEGQAPTH